MLYEHRLPCMWSHMPETASTLEAEADRAKVQDYPALKSELKASLGNTPEFNKKIGAVIQR